MIETDVRMTQDRKLILCHDAVIWGHAVSKNSYEDLIRYAPERPLLSDVLDCLAGLVKFDFEIKAAAVDEVGRMLKAYNVENSAIVTSFDLEFLDEFIYQYEEE